MWKFVPSESSRPPLDGVRILFFEHYGAGPLVTMHLADLGAEILKASDTETIHRLGPRLG